MPCASVANTVFAVCSVSQEVKEKFDADEPTRTDVLGLSKADLSNLGLGVFAANAVLRWLRSQDDHDCVAVVSVDGGGRSSGRKRKLDSFTVAEAYQAFDDDVDTTHDDWTASHPSDKKRFKSGAFDTYRKIFKAIKDQDAANAGWEEFARADNVFSELMMHDSKVSKYIKKSLKAFKKQQKEQQREEEE